MQLLDLMESQEHASRNNNFKIDKPYMEENKSKILKQLNYIFPRTNFSDQWTIGATK